MNRYEPIGLKEIVVSKFCQFKCVNFRNMEIPWLIYMWIFVNVWAWDLSWFILSYDLSQAHVQIIIRDGILNLSCTIDVNKLTFFVIWISRSFPNILYHDVKGLKNRRFIGGEKLDRYQGIFNLEIKVFNLKTYFLIHVQWWKYRYIRLDYGRKVNDVQPLGDNARNNIQWDTYNIYNM